MVSPQDSTYPGAHTRNKTTARNWAAEARIMKKPPLAVLYAAVLVDMMGFGIVLPLLPFYATSLGATSLQVTLIGASFSAMQLAAAPIWGRVSDRKGRRPLLIAGLFASSVSYLVFGLAHSLWLLLLSRIVAGAAGGTISVAQAYVADSTTSEERASGMGRGKLGFAECHGRNPRQRHRLRQLGHERARRLIAVRFVCAQ